jgi:L-lysine 6-transaminase
MQPSRFLLGSAARRVTALWIGYRVRSASQFDQTGSDQPAGGQTGAVFACDLFDLPRSPHAVATAKKFGNGAVFMLHPIDDLGVLDSTWGGSLADMVRFVAEWEIVGEEQLLEAVPVKTELLVSGLRALQRRFPNKLGNIRGLGLYQGFTVKAPLKRSALVDAALGRERLLLLGAGTDAIRLRPPLSVTAEDIALLLEKLGRLFAAV